MSVNFTSLPSVSTEIFVGSTFGVRPRVDLKKLKKELNKGLTNNSVSRKLWNQMPGARPITRAGDPISCPVLQTNNSMAYIVPGWEGIPVNILLNIVLSLIILISFTIFIRRVYRTDKMRGQHSKSSNWVHFIYGERAANDDIDYKTRQINRDHPNAYLPVILHKYRHLISSINSNDYNDDNIDGQQSQLYLSSSQTGQKNNVLKTSGKQSGKPNVTDSVIAEKKQIEKLTSKLWEAEINIRKTKQMDQSVALNHKPSTLCQSFKQWFIKYLLIKDEAIIIKRGLDAYQYLLFQRYIIYLLTFLTVICLLIILPINLYEGGLPKNEANYYLRTTILNLRQESSLIYIHAILTIVVVLLGIFLMVRFNEFVRRRVVDVDKRILLIENIPQIKRHSINMNSYFEQNFPNVVIQRMTFVYNIDKLSDLLMKLWTSIEAKNYCRIYFSKYGQRCEVRPYFLGHFKGILCCCYCNPKVDGLTYYTWEKETLEKEIDKEVNKVTKNPERMVFVVFENEKMAKLVYKHFRQQNYYCSSLTIWIRWLFKCYNKKDSFDSWQWDVSYAPFPDDIDWLEVHSNNLRVWSLNIVMNILIFLTFVFISTPASVFKIINFFLILKPIRDSNEQIDPNDKTIVRDHVVLIFWQYFPTLVYTIMASILPTFVKLLTNFIPFRTKSDYNHSIMYKSYIFLVLMVLILPSLEIITVYTLFERQITGNNTDIDPVINWNCLFPAENSAFFINYLLTSAFVGNAIEIVQLSEVANYFLMFVIYSRTYAEYLTARQKTEFDFYFGTYYPRILLLFTLMVTFSISSPLIAPIGLFYLVAKHLVDRYLIFHIYVPTKIDRRIHSKAVLIVYISLLFLLIQVYTHLASMDHKFPSVLVGITFILHLLFTLFVYIWDTFHRLFIAF